MKHVFLLILLFFAGLLPAGVHTNGVQVAEPNKYSNVHSVLTPLGLRVRPVGVHDELKSVSDVESTSPHVLHGTGEFRHGNLTVRLVVDNPTTSTQPLGISIPVVANGSACRGEYAYIYRGMCSVAPGVNQVVDFSLPHTGNMFHIMWTPDWQVVDASGRAAKPSEAGCMYGEKHAFFMPIEDRQSPYVEGCDTPECTVAVSRSFQGGYAANRKTYDGRVYYVAHPDLTGFTDWRDLACYDAVVFTPADWAACAPEFRELVKDFQAAGGKFLIAEKWKDVDVAKLNSELSDVDRALCGYVLDSVYASDHDAISRAWELRNALPFGVIVLVLLVFSILAGPVLIRVLARRGLRLHLIWVFPVIAIVFSVAVTLTIVLTNGFEVKVTTFRTEVDHPELERKVIVKNTIYVSPFPMTKPIVCSPTALVTVDSGDASFSGDFVESTPEALKLTGNWTPCLWPVRVRELEVVRTAKETKK